MKKTGVLITAALILLGMCSCASSDRMLRLSPLGASDATQKIDLNKKLLNAWPFFYQDDRFVSILWPMIDFDDQGFAVRPFYNKEENDHSVLFPLSSWNTASRYGYALNTVWTPRTLYVIPFYMTGSNFFSILFPLSYFDSSFGWVMNTVWAKDCLVVFPLFASVDDFSHILNVYWHYSKEEGLEDYGFFPLFHHSPGFRQWLFPLYSLQSGEDRQTLLTPLFGYTMTEDRMTMLNILMTAYYASEEPGRRVRAICWPLVYQEWKDGRLKYHVLPFYSHDSGWPALVNWTRGEAITNGVRDNFNILGPFGYQHTVRTYNPPEDFLPQNKLPLSNRLGCVAKSSEEDYILGGLFSWGTEKYLVWRPEHASRLHELDQRLRRLPYKSQTGTAPAAEQNPEIAGFLRDFPEIPPDSSCKEIIKLLKENYTTTTESNYHQFIPFYRYRSYQENYNWSLLLRLLGSGYRDHDEEGMRITPFFSWNTAPDTFEYSILWPLFQYRDHSREGSRWRLFYFLAGGETKGADSDLQILGYLYRHTVEGDSEQYSIFPFISYRKNSEKKQFSFLWRIFNYERAGGETSGHIFFIPW